MTQSVFSLISYRAVWMAAGSSQTSPPKACYAGEAQVAPRAACEPEKRSSRIVGRYEGRRRSTRARGAVGMLDQP